MDDQFCVTFGHNSPCLGKAQGVEAQIHFSENKKKSRLGLRHHQIGKIFDDELVSLHCLH
jgi:hypothetical protein